MPLGNSLTYMGKVRSIQVVAGVLAFVLGVFGQAAQAADPPLDLAKWLFLTQLGDAPKDSVVCPSFDWKPVPEPLLHSLRAESSRFVRSTECVRVMNVHRGSFHRPSGRPAYLFSLRDFKLLSNGHAIVGIDQYFNGKWATHESVEAYQSDGQWTLVRIFDRSEA